MRVALKSDLKEKEIELFGILLYMNIIMQMVESVVPFPLSIFKVLYCISFLFTLKILICNIQSYKELLRVMWKSIKLEKLSVFFLGIYIIWDLINTIYAADVGYALTKYVVILEMTILLLLVCFYIALKKLKGEYHGEKERNRILFALIIVEVVISIIAILNYRFEFFPLIYYKRLSTYRDYNQLGTLILLGYIAGIWLILNKNKKWWLTYLRLGILSLFSVTILYLVSSRRNYILLLLTVAGILCYLFITNSCILKEKSPEKLKRAIILIIASALIYSVSIRICEETQNIFEIRYEREETLLKENAVDDTMETIMSGGFMKKRLNIWNIALDEIKGFSGKELLIGKGGSYQSDIYDIPENRERLMDMYHLKEEPENHWMSPHNFILSDLLTGGAVKVCISLAIIISIAYYLLRDMRRDFRQTLFLTVLFGIVYLNSFISYQFGYIGDKHYWIIFLLFFICQNRKSGQNEMR